MDWELLGRATAMYYSTPSDKDREVNLYVKFINGIPFFKAETLQFKTSYAIATYVVDNKIIGTFVIDRKILHLTLPSLDSPISEEQPLS